MIKGILSLDIDGTLTAENHTVPSRVIQFLNEQIANGWRLVLITGRTFNMVCPIIKLIPFSYILALQNGSIILDMPSRKILQKKYLKRNLLPQVDKICESMQTGCIIYSGYENQDRCYYKRSQFDSDILSYLDRRIEEFNETWIDVDSWGEISLQEFPSLKCFGKENQAVRLSNEFDKLSFHAPFIRDPFDRNYFVIQATRDHVDKGYALEDCKKSIGDVPVIAAGDDYNDQPMLEKADFKVVMETAPDKIKDLADIIALSAEEDGIIQGLREAMKRL